MCTCLYVSAWQVRGVCVWGVSSVVAAYEVCVCARACVHSCVCVKGKGQVVQYRCSQLPMYSILQKL